MAQRGCSSAAGPAGGARVAAAAWAAAAAAALALGWRLGAASLHTGSWTSLRIRCLRAELRLPASCAPSVGAENSEYCLPRMNACAEGEGLSVEASGRWCVGFLDHFTALCCSRIGSFRKKGKELGGL